MPERYFEDATVTITETLSTKKFLRTKPYSGPAKLNFYKGAEAGPFFTSTVNVVDGKLEKEFKHRLPLVEKKEEYYELRVTCEYKKTSKKLFVAGIWPKQAQVLFQDLGKQPLKTFAFLVKQKGIEDQKLTTGADGKCAITLMARAPFTIVPDGKFKLISDEQVTAGEFRDHKITVETVITARFQSPDISQDIYKDDPDAAPAKMQYVNLKTKEKDHEIDCGCDAKGRLVVFTVTADPPEDGQPGDKVYFEITLGKESKRNNPAPGLSAEWPVHEKKVADKKTTGWVVLAPMGDIASGYFEVDLGIAGGDTCQVKIGGTPAVADAELKLVNWRKMYAQVTKTAAAAAPSLAAVVTSLKKVFVDFEESVADATVVDTGTAPAGSVVDGNALIKKGMPTTSLIVGDHNVDSFKTKLKPRFKSEDLPCAHIIYCDEQLDGNNAVYDSSTVVLGKKVGQAQDIVDFPGGGSVPGVAIPGTAANKNGVFFAKDLKDNSEAVKLCKWEEVGGAGSGDIPDTDYKIDHPNNGNTLFIRLPNAAKLLSDAGKSIKVSYQVAWSKGWFNGWCTNGDRHLVIKLGRPDADTCGTIIHEVGHAISQSAKDAGTYPGLTLPHPRFYTNNRGHFGPHCADGIDEEYYKDASKMMNAKHASDLCTCIMYGSTAARKTKLLDFCAKCAPYAKAAPITSMST